MSTAEALQTLHTATVSQYGLITTAQAARIGISRTALARLVDGEALARIRHGVYVLPSSDGDPDQDLRAAWLSTDPRRFADERARAVDTPVVSHASASALHRMGDLIPIRHSFTAPQRKQTRHPLPPRGARPRRDHPGQRHARHHRPPNARGSGRRLRR